ncbi:RNA-binding protein 10 [Babesia ovis]|uniref:RNA-binding protein 10 n=1 Tax=Babesia ovis TaxID=5869 RepID=A0A9W5WU56_BABOV|nr:RNA-binding protein 10 [Babesia ovis]
MCAWERYDERNTSGRRQRRYYDESSGRSYGNERARVYDDGYDERDRRYSDYGYDERDRRYSDYGYDERDRRYSDYGYDERVRGYEDRGYDERDRRYSDYGYDERSRKYTYHDEYRDEHGYRKSYNEYEKSYDRPYSESHKVDNNTDSRIFQKHDSQTQPDDHNKDGSRVETHVSPQEQDYSTDVTYNYKDKHAARYLQKLVQREKQNDTNINKDDNVDNHNSNTENKQEWYMQSRYQQSGSKRSDNEKQETQGYCHHGKSRRYNSDETTERENSATVLLRNLETTVSAEDVESGVSDICIQNGFSAPNTVTINSTKGHYVTDAMMDVAVERYAVITFPSPANAARFMECVKSRKLEVNSREYYVEYDTLDVNTEKPRIETTMTYEDYKEYDAIMKKRLQSCDWICPTCRFVNFARRTQCFSCEAEKPSEKQLQSKNLLVDPAATVQKQMIHKNVTDVSSWVVLKGIPLAADPSNLVMMVCSSVPEGAAHLQRCVYVIDPQPTTKRGFMFCQFASAKPVTAFQEALGNKASALIQLQGTYLRLDAVRSLEKQVADELLKNVKTNTLKVHYEFHTETFQATPLTDEPSTKQVGNKECRTCKVRTTNVGTLEQLATSHSAPPGSLQYVNSWLGKVILLPNGKPDTARLTYDPNSDYFYDHHLGIYFDAASGFYISLNGEYYLWDEPSKSLVLAQQPGSDATKIDNTGGQTTSQLQGLLEAAMKAAQMTNENSHKPSHGIANQATTDGDQEEPMEIEDTQTTQPANMTNNRINMDVSRTFDLGMHSDDECDMEVDSIETDNKAEVDTATKTVQLQIRPLVVCLVCIRMFPDKARLELHERRSRYHQAILECESGTIQQK